MPVDAEAKKKQPWVHEFIDVPNVEHALRVFADQPGALLLESALKREEIGRYSFLTAAPFRSFELDQPSYGCDPFVEVRAAHAQFASATIAGLPPFQGGAAGLLSYELGGCWEKLPVPALDEFGFPAMAVGLYDWVLAWDHLQSKAWVIAHELTSHEHGMSAENRINWVLAQLERSPADSGPVPECGELQNLAPQFNLDVPQAVSSTFSKDSYLQAVQQVIDYIFAGDIFQANLSQRLLSKSPCSPLDLYVRLRTCNPAPFSAYFSWDDWDVISSSPERFVTVRDRVVETRPIKGTRKRRTLPEADLYTRDELRESAKDQAENVMIVDLLRNDLSRVCQPGSISVSKLCAVETYETVQHLVSVIHGTLRPECDPWKLLEAVFPGGSITGAPKVRAMEIISALEPTARGPYCGSLFYLGFDGQMDSNILIRSFAHRKGWLNFPVGGGIVAQSDPLAEFEETLHKADGMLRALA